MMLTFSKSTPRMVLANYSPVQNAASRQRQRLRTLMLITRVALKCLFMQQGHFAPVALERLFLQINGIKVARDSASIIKHPAANLIR
jgi:hypothetical protein